jgi:DNA mismatch endonuclease, patch repair protein
LGTHDLESYASTMTEPPTADDIPLPPVPAPSSATVVAVMRGNRSRDTAPELALRSALHRRGLRFYKNRRVETVRRSVDILFPTARIAVFVDGCFWHGCPAHYRRARRNTAFWDTKIARNRARDAKTNLALRAAGWTVMRVWEHESPEQAAAKIETAVRALRPPKAR